MKIENFRLEGREIPVMILDSIVIGSGSAAFNAADWLYDLGRRQIGIVTEDINMGTSRNAGSDKQTYYKLTLAGDQGDSVHEMAQDLFAGGGVDGDHAFIEAANSVKAFMKLVLLGVPFPSNEWGEYVGYRTDHDAKRRAASAGPLTSRYMTECLERSVKSKKITILDRMQVFEIVTEGEEAAGVLCVDKEQNGAGSPGLCCIFARHIVAATGGPAGCYYDSVYPEGHTGMSGMLFEAGVRGANLNCCQYGLASVKFRWNVSGSYQQALPRYISVDEAGREHEFLEEYYQDPCLAADMIFLKGYQWPFDREKLSGSSGIDMLVHRQTAELGRRVYLDFRRNPGGVKRDFSGLSGETFGYLKNSGALLATPIARLEKMNSPAIELYKKHGIDLYREPLEVRVCAQHHNGGAEVDENYQTCVRGLYVVGEAAGIYGLKRPGGSALNSCQVGSMRAAEHIAYQTKESLFVSDGQRAAMERAVEKWRNRLRQPAGSKDREELLEQREYFQKKMSGCAAHIRDYEKMRVLYGEIQEALSTFDGGLQGRSHEDLPIEIKNRDILITQLTVLSAMLEETEDMDGAGRLISVYRRGQCSSGFRPVRKLQEPDSWFESVWQTYRDRTGNNPGNRTNA